MLALIGKRLKLFKRFSGDRKAAAAVEFALIAAPLIFMICCSIEVGMIFLVSVTLDNATDVAARGIRTGLTTGGNTTQAQFVQAICNNMGWLASSCPSSLSVDVQTFSSFTAVTTVSSLVQNGKLLPPAYAVGGGSQIQMVRVYYDWPLFTPLMNPSLSTLANGDAVLTYKVVFRNEPF